MTPFDYRRPSTLAQAVEWMGAEPDAKLLAGGQSLLAAMKLRFAAPTVLIDLQGLPELATIEQRGNELWIGAMCSHAKVASSELVQRLAPALATLANGIGDRQVRNRGTVGGSVANADPAACWPAGLVAFGATVVTDRREVAADDFFNGLFSTALASDEIVCGVRFPAIQHACYIKFEQAASRFALTGVAVARMNSRSGNDVRVAVTGLGSGVCRWADAEQALLEHFSPDAVAALQPDASLAFGDIHASADYRLHLAKVLTQRAVKQIIQQASTSGDHHV